MDLNDFYYCAEQMFVSLVTSFFENPARSALGKVVRLPWPPVIWHQSFVSVSTKILGNKLMDSNIQMEFQTMKRCKALTALAYQQIQLLKH